MAHGSGLRVYLLLYLGQPHEVSFPFRSLDLRAGYHNFNESIRSRDIPRNDNDTMLIFRLGSDAGFIDCLSPRHF